MSNKPEEFVLTDGQSKNPIYFLYNHNRVELEIDSKNPERILVTKINGEKCNKQIIRKQDPQLFDEIVEQIKQETKNSRAR